MPLRAQALGGGVRLVVPAASEKSASMTSIRMARHVAAANLIVSARAKQPASIIRGEMSHGAGVSLAAKTLTRVPPAMQACWLRRRAFARRRGLALELSRRRSARARRVIPKPQTSRNSEIAVRGPKASV